MDGKSVSKQNTIDEGKRGREGGQRRKGPFNEDDDDVYALAQRIRHRVAPRIYFVRVMPT